MRRRLAAALAVAALVATACSGEAPLPPGAVRHDGYEFAIVPPPGWTRVDPGQAANDTLMAYGDRLQDTFREYLVRPMAPGGSNEFVIAFLKTDATEELMPHIAVVRNRFGLKQVTDAEKEAARKVLAGKFVPPVWPEAVAESLDLIEIDRRKVIRSVYSGTLVTRLHTRPEVTRAYKVRHVEAMIAATNVTHFVSLTADQAQFEQYRPIFDQALNSFRSLGRR